MMVYDENTNYNLISPIGYMRTNDAIDMKRQFSWIVNNTGWFVGWRKFDLTTHSPYWDDISKEAIGGPAWNYKDYIFKTRRVAPGRSSMDNEFLQRYGLTDRGVLIYYVSSVIDIKEEDLLFRIENETSPTPMDSVVIKEVYEIIDIEPKIMSGSLIYNIVKVKPFINQRDETIRGRIPVEYIPV